MNEVSLLRLYMLRAAYLLLVVGLGITIWPLIISHGNDVPLMKGVVRALLGTICLLAIVGLRYPLQMLPLLFFEIIWKIIWLLSFALPLWRTNLLDADTTETIHECAMVVILPILMPWGYVWAHYIKQPTDRWK